MKIVSKDSLYRSIIYILIFIIIISCFIMRIVTSKLNAPYSQWFNREIQINGKNMVVSAIQQAGPLFSGDIEVNVLINYVPEEFNTYISNKGHSLSDENYVLESNDEYIKLVFLNKEGEVEFVYRFYYCDLDEYDKEESHIEL